MRRVAVALAVVALAGCGGDDSEPQEPPEARETAAETFDRLAGSLRDLEAAARRRDCESISRQVEKVREQLDGLEGTQAAAKDIAAARDLARPVLADAEALC